MKNRYIIPILIILTILLLIKVYVANELYYTSRNIQKISIQINALKEEKNILQLKIEKLKYKNTIIDPLFNYKPDEDIEISNSNATVTNDTQNTNNKSTKKLFENISTDNGE